MNRTPRYRARILSAVVSGLAISTMGLSAQADVGPITFGPGDYDNTANVVLAGPTPSNLQTTGLFRDVFWWQLNNGLPKVGSSDFINQGNSLVLIGNSAGPGPGPVTALNFTGPSVSSNPGFQSYMAIYDTTPGDGTATRNLFDAAGGLTISADVLFVKHNSSGGVVALYSEGQDALALLASNTDGNNLDQPKLSLVWQSQGSGTVLQSITLPASTFVAQEWYRVTMNLSVAGDVWTMNGTIQDHLIGSDPSSGLNSTLWSLQYIGSLSDPDNGPSSLVLTNPGEIGVMAMGNESISLPDNVGVSITNFGATPEPGTLSILGLGVAGLFARRRSQR